MEREEVINEVLALNVNNLLLEFPTGYGKSKLALDIANQKYGKNHFKNIKILIVFPKVVLKSNWEEEIRKWFPKEADKLLSEIITLTTYASLPKHAGKWNIVIFDECHHITENCINTLQSFTIDYSLLLSATVKRNRRWELKNAFKELYIYKVPIRDAIDSKVLPDPRIILIPMKLDDIHLSEEITLKSGRVVKYTPKKYYENISNLVEWYKKKAMGGSQASKNFWLYKAGERLKWLSKQKSPIVTEILKVLKQKRTLTFCSSIEQTEILGKNHIHCKNKASRDILEKFNEGKIKHITSVNMLDEGINLKNCQIGIYANLNSSERIVKQRLGRILRHKKPVIIIPFFLNTRDEEIVKQMIIDYNPELISVVYNVKDIKI